MGTLVRTRITVMFEEPFRIALYERENGGKYEVCKITFGAEPKDSEVHEFLLRNHKHLPFSPQIEAAAVEERRLNPKRMQREAKKATEVRPLGTKAQQALKLQQEQRKLERKTHSREQKEKQAERKFELRQEKKKQKHKGH